MIQATRDALNEFTDRYLKHWRQHPNQYPTSAELYGVPSPCIVKTLDAAVCWQPKAPLASQNLVPVTQGLGIELHPSVIGFYSCQLAGDMYANCNGMKIQLLQVWSEEDLKRLQANIIGHLLMKQRLKQPATVFIATTDDESEAICVDNLTGEVVLERMARHAQRQILAPRLDFFLANLLPIVQEN